MKKKEIRNVIQMAQLLTKFDTSKLYEVDGSPQPKQTSNKTLVYSILCFCFVIFGQLFVPLYAANYQNKIFDFFSSSNHYLK